MDKRSLLGFVLIGIVLMIWLYWNSSTQQEAVMKSKRQADSLAQLQKSDSIVTPVLTKDTTAKDTTSAKNKLVDSLMLKSGSLFYARTSGTENAAKEKVIMLESDKIQMEFTNYGGCIRKYTIKDYETWDKKPLQLVDWKKGKELSLLFTSKEGKLINTKDLVFDGNYAEWQKVDLTKDSTFKLIYTLPLGADSSGKIIITYTFFANKYEFDVDYEFVNSSLFVTNNKYQVVWESSLNMTEFRSDQEVTYEEAFAHMGGELETLDAANFDEEYKGDFNGNTDYVSLRTKYFGLYLIPKDKKGDGAYLSGYREKLPDNGQRENYSIGVKMDIKNDKTDKSSFLVLLTPLDYNILKDYDRDLEKTMRFSLDFIVRPIAQFIILPVFKLLHSFIPSWGLVIILFALIMKIVLTPLTKSQTNSMKKMSELNPKIKVIREKYKDDPVKANEQIMKLYKEEKINPAGGCLPMLLQLPILYALFGVFNSTVELRNASFLWIKDLASPDVIFNLPFKIPIFGIDQISGLALLLGVTMFLQQKMTMTDPQQKALIYIMPVMLTLLFFSFPAGLNLYYLMFNVFTIADQYWKKLKTPPKEESTDAKTNVPALSSKKPKQGK
jgi:YidC/Oxa1 family membrane protein insertase